ncbi:MAG: histidine kinase [Acidimicrobiales bacterium]
MGAVGRTRYWPIAVSAAVWVVTIASIVTAVAFDRRLDRIGRSDLVGLQPEVWIIIAAIASALIVGTALTMRRPDHPVGWLFLALGGSMALSGPIDSYATYGAVARPGSLPGADAVAYIGDAAFLPWLVIVALVLHLTPTGRALSPRWRLVARLTVASGALAAVGSVLTSDPLDPPFAAVRNPLAVGGLDGVVSVGRAVGSILTGVGLIVAGASIVVRFRRSKGVERRQLWWLALVAIPLPLFVPAAFIAARTDHPAALLIATGGFIVLVPIAAALAITQYHLYEVERILSRTVTYVLLTVVLAATYAAVVVMAGRGLAGLAGSSALSAVLGTLAAVSVAAPARRQIQDALDRRFNRRRFDALRIVREHLRQPTVGAPIEDVLQWAVADPSLAVSYWVDDRQWVSAAGLPSGADGHAVEVRRDDRPVARVTFDAAAVDGELVEAVAREALSELDNARLRAAISLQLVEVNESRARIAAAQMAERRKLERNLHDGAQQRLLGLAFQLQAAQLNGDIERLREAVGAGIDQTRATVLELRAIANGLHPAVLADGGLAAALDDLAARSSLPVEVHATDARFAPDVEAAVWYVVCEALVNAQKHANATTVAIEVDQRDGWLTVTVEDDGTGGADPAGSGLQGTRDRSAAAGGTLEIRAGRDGGTVVTGRLPCGS